MNMKIEAPMPHRLSARSQAQVQSRLQMQTQQVGTSIAQMSRHLPAHPPYYAKDELTDKPERFFASEIFKYPESLSELSRSESLPEYDELLQEILVPVQQPLILTADNAPNTLPQIIHLSYKNHALFSLDVLRHRLLTNAPSDDELREYIADTVPRSRANSIVTDAVMKSVQKDMICNEFFWGR